MNRALDAQSVDELLDLVITANHQTDRALEQEAIGALTLLLGNIIRWQNAELFRAALGKLYEAVDPADARWMLKAVRQGLPEEQLAWMDGQIEAIRQGSIDDG